MAVYMIGYDLNRPGQNYPDLIDALKTYSTRWHCLDSTWLVKTTKSAEQIRDELTPHIDTGDELLVATLTGESAWHGFDKNCADWLRNQLQ